MKHLCYRGGFYKYAQPTMQHLQSKNSCRLMQMMRYRGVFYLREVRSSNPKSPCSRVVFLLNNSTPADVSNCRCEIQNEQMGYLYRLYCLGWRNGSIKCFSLLQHWLLSIFLYYRQGFAKGTEWKQNQIKS